MRRSTIICTFVSLYALAGVAAASAAPGPVDPIEVLNGGDLRDPRPWTAPDGGQIVTYREVSGPQSVRLIERRDGATFASPIELSTVGNAEPPDLSFTPDGGTYAVWGVSTTGSTAQQAIRAPGGEFTPAAPVGGCGRFVDSAAGPGGELALACMFTSPSPPTTSNLRFSTLPALAPFSLSDLDDRIQPVYDNFIQPRVAWGQDGTLAFAARYKTTTTNPPPANETRRIRVVLPLIAETNDIVQVTEPDTAQLGGLAVASDGRIAVSYSTDSGPLLRIRPAGPAGQVYASHPLPGEEVTAPVFEEAGPVHVMSVVQGPDRLYFANVKGTGPEPVASTPIPLGGQGDPYIPYEEGFQVAPDGTEYAVIRADDGVYATSREPGATAFSTPAKLGPAPDSNPSSTVTGDGDLLVTWNTGPAGGQKLIVGGLDGHAPKVVVESFPESGTIGVPLEFAASATDSMGMRSTSWNFGGGSAVAGDRATHTFSRPGAHQVTFTATDRAGNETVERRTVRVPGGGDGDSPRMSVKVPKKLAFRALARRGVRVKVSANRPLRIKASIGTSKRKARRKPLGVKAVKKLRAKHTVRVRPKRKRLGKKRAFRLHVRVTGTDRSGAKITKVKRVRIRR